MENLRHVIYSIVEQQYEDGWHRVSDIDNLTDNILATFKSFLDSFPNFSYNGEQERENHAQADRN